MSTFPFVVFCFCFVGMVMGLLWLCCITQAGLKLALLPVFQVLGLQVHVTLPDSAIRDFFFPLRQNVIDPRPALNVLSWGWLWPSDLSASITSWVVGLQHAWLMWCGGWNPRLCALEASTPPAEPPATPISVPCSSPPYFIRASAGLPVAFPCHSSLAPLILNYVILVFFKDWPLKN